jgi:adenylosuccinate lyase
VSGVLVDRYASKEMREIWSREFKIKAERRLWISVLETQSSLGLDVLPTVIEDYRKNAAVIDLASIDARENITKHDVKARIDEFNELAGHQKIHIGMTSRDLTENIELFQVSSSLKVVTVKAAALLKVLADFAEAHSEVPLVARTHNVPAQLTTLGRRAATWMEELLFAFNHLQHLSERLPLKGIKGPIGTAQDLLDLFGDSSQVIEDALAADLGFRVVLDTPAQIYPRSIDYEVVTALVQLAASPSNIATSIRIMSGFGLVTEGFGKDQVGSSAMPHKINARLSERVNGFTAVLKGNAVMIQELVGNQWNEGDVSCSVVRRVALADSFYAIDSILDTAIRIMRDLTVNFEEIMHEVDRNLPFLSTTRLISILIKNGKGREEAYSAIKDLTIAARKNIRQNGENNLYELVREDSSLEISEDILNSLYDPQNLIGQAKKQTKAVITRAWCVLDSYPESLTYHPANSI